ASRQAKETRSTRRDSARGCGQTRIRSAAVRPEAFGRSTNLEGEADVLLGDPLADDRFAAAAHHPLEPMIAILAHPSSRSDQLGNLLDRRHCRVERLNAASRAVARARALEPGGERRSGGRREAEHGGHLDVREHGDVAGTEALAVEPLAASELALEPGVYSAPLIGGAHRQRFGERSARSTEETDLVESPIDRLNVGVADVLDHPYTSALGG